MVKKVFSFVSILAMVLLVLSTQGTPSAAAQSVPAPIRLVRTLEADETGMSNPVGIAYSQLGSRYHLVSAYDQGQRLPALLEVQQLDRFTDPTGSIPLQVSVGEPINITFDNISGRLLVYQSSSSSLVEVKQDSAGNLLSTRQTAYDFRGFGMQSAQGMSFDGKSGVLYILDSAAQRVLRIKPGSDGSFTSASAVTVDLSALGSTSLRGLAIDPASGNLFVIDPEELALFELTSDGDLVSQRDLSVFGVQNPQGMTFAPSGDQTDDPDEMSLYLADSGELVNASYGSILELSLLEAPVIEEFAFTSNLVNTIDLSGIVPPSPDATGIAYHSDNGTLLISDSEVEEAVSSAYWQNTNVWELALDGSTVYSTGNTSYTPVVNKPFSDEPTDVAYNPDNKHYYFSDDNLDNITDLNPGVDATMWTGDDVVTSFPVTSGSGDPEGVAYGDGYIFVADGINSEIYKYNVSGVLLDQFDTEAMGVVNPNAVEYNALSDTLLILSNNGDEVIAETTTSGALLRTIDVSSIPLVSPDGLTYAPPTDGDTRYHYYIVDRGIDNDNDPTPDAKIFEITAPEPITTGNQPLVVNAGPDQNITFPTNLINLDGTVTDDGIPGLGVTSLWTVASGACGVSFGNPTAVDTTATFTYGGLYELQLEASDTELNAWDTLLVQVSRADPTMTFDSYVEAKWDDAEERADGTIGREGTTIELGEHLSNGAQTDGFRFNWLDIPQGATILNAYIQFTAHDRDISGANLLIKGEASDNAATFLNVDNDISSRTTTTASVAWSPSQWNTINQRGVDQRTPNLAPILQEIVNRPGWQSGNSAAFIITGTGTRRAYGYEGNPCDAAMLHIEWEMGAPNNPPVAVDDSATVAEDSIDNIIDVLTNDTDLDGDTLSVTAVGTASHGSVTLTAGVVKYTPTSNYVGPDSFTYTVSDGLLTDEGLVSITVTNVNDPPVAVDDLATVAEDSIANIINVLTNDTDIDTGDVLTVTAVGTASHGTVTLTAGVVKYTPDTGFVGIDSFTYTVSDGALTDGGVVNITVGTNHPPVAVADAYVVLVNRTLVVLPADGVLKNDSDEDGHALTAILVTTPGHHDGLFILNPDGSFTYTPAAGFFGTDTFTYKVNDGLVDSGVVTVTISVRLPLFLPIILK